MNDDDIGKMHASRGKKSLFAISESRMIPLTSSQKTALTTYQTSLTTYQTSLTTYQKAKADHD